MRQELTLVIEPQEQLQLGKGKAITFNLGDQLLVFRFHMSSNGKVSAAAAVPEISDNGAAPFGFTKSGKIRKRRSIEQAVAAGTSRTLKQQVVVKGPMGRPPKFVRRGICPSCHRNLNNGGRHDAHCKALRAHTAAKARAAKAVKAQRRSAAARTAALAKAAQDREKRKQQQA